MTEYIAAATVKAGDDLDEADAILDAFLEIAADAGPVIGQDLRQHTLDVGLSVNAGSPEEALSAARPIFAAGFRAAGLDDRPIIGLSAELADGERQVA
jgi:hypothetical protein